MGNVRHFCQIPAERRARAFATKFFCWISEQRLQNSQPLIKMRLIIICDVRAVAFMSSPEFAVQALYRSHHGWLNAWLRARLGNAADAADLAQDTFVRLLQRSERLELKAPRAFLSTIARGLVPESSVRRVARRTS